MAEYQGEYGHPYPRVDQYGNPVPPVDAYGNPVPREPPPAAGLVGGTTAPLYGAAGDTAGAGYAAAAPGGDYGAAYPSGGVAPGETALAYEGMVGGGGGIGAATATAGMLGGQLQPARAEEHTFGSCQLEPTRSREEHTTLGEKLTRSGSSSSSSEDNGQGGRRKKKSIKEKIKEKLPGTHKREGGHGAPAVTTTGTTHAAGAHEKKGFMDKIKEKLPGHH